MASYTLYEASIGTGKNALNALSAILAKIEASPVADKIPEARIHPDMLPFSFQVFMITDTIAKMAARVTGGEVPKLDRELPDLAAIKARVEDVKARVAAVSRETVNSRENEIVGVGLGPNKPEGKMQSWQYVQGYAIPNIFFHLTTAYDIARKEGVEVGKMDYLSSFLQQYLEGQ